MPQHEESCFVFTPEQFADIIKLGVTSAFQHHGQGVVDKRLEYFNECLRTWIRGLYGRDEPRFKHRHYVLTRVWMGLRGEHMPGEELVVTDWKVVTSAVSNAISLIARDRKQAQCFSDREIAHEKKHGYVVAAHLFSELHHYVVRDGNPDNYAWMCVLKRIGRQLARAAKK